MRITIAWLKKHSACSDAVKFFQDGKSTDLEFQWKRFYKAKRYSDLNWFLSRRLKRKDKIRYAIFAAEQVIGLYRKKDDRPRKAINAAKKVIEKDNRNNRVAAYYAAAAANAAAYAAYVDADAYTADAYTADAAAYAAYTAAAAYVDDAACTAYAAVDAAYAAADKEKMQRKILNYGYKLLCKSKTII